LFCFFVSYRFVTDADIYITVLVHYFIDCMYVMCSRFSSYKRF
jgi:hypothetical protein